MKWKSVFAAFAVVFGMTSGGALAADITLRIGAGHPTPALAYVLAADTHFVPEVTRRAKEKGHNVRFVKAWAGTVAKVDGIVEAVQKGALDIGLSVPAFEQARTSILNYSLYFPFSSTDPMRQVKVAQRMLKEVPALQDAMTPYGNRILAMSVAENYGLMLKNELNALDNLKGRKLACAGTNAPWASAVGAVCVQLPIGENYLAIQTGLIEGNIFFMSGFESFRLKEVARIWLQADLGSFVSNAMLMNADVRNKLPRELVEIIDQVAAETAVKTAEISKQREEQAEVKIRGTVKIIKLSDADKRRWAELMKDLPAKSAKELDARGFPATDVYRKYAQFVRESGHKFPFDYPL